MPARCHFHYGEFTQELADAMRAQRRARQRFRQLVRVVRQLFRVRRCEVQLPVAGALVLRACFADRRRVPPWSVVQTLTADHLHPGGLCGVANNCVGFGDYRLSTGLDCWSPDGVPEYYFEVRLERPAYLPN